MNDDMHNKHHQAVFSVSCEGDGTITRILANTILEDARLEGRSLYDLVSPGGRARLGTFLETISAGKSVFGTVLPVITGSDTVDLTVSGCMHNGELIIIGGFSRLPAETTVSKDTVDDRTLFERFTELNNRLISTQRELMKKNASLEHALNEIQTLRGLLPICAFCNKIRDDRGYWNKLESYIETHSSVKFSHSICPDCMRIHFPDAEKDDQD